MVEINLIKIEDGVVKIECIPERNLNEKFILEIDPIHKKILSTTRKKDVYVSHAAYRIYKEYEENNKIPQQTVAVWY